MNEGAKRWLKTPVIGRIMVQKSRHFTLQLRSPPVFRGVCILSKAWHAACCPTFVSYGRAAQELRPGEDNHFGGRHGKVIGNPDPHAACAAIRDALHIGIEQNIF